MSRPEDKDDDEVRIGDVKENENRLASLRQELEDEEENVKLYKVEIATNEKYWN